MEPLRGFTRNVLQYAGTSNGSWYPKKAVFVRDKASYLFLMYIDDSCSIDDKLFDEDSILACHLASLDVYNRVSDSERIDIGRRVAINDPNWDPRSGVGGKIDDKNTVEVMIDPRYIIRDSKTKQVDREFGCAELVGMSGDTWEVNKPWMKVYQPKVRVEITADKATTRIETVAGSSSRKGVTFSGNVVIKITPAPGGLFKKSTIYTDSLMFLADSSQFLASGPVKLVF